MGKKKIIAVDGDIIAYRCAASCEPNRVKPFLEPVRFAIARMGEVLSHIQAVQEEYGCEEMKMYITGSRNYRKVLDPTYKAHRTQPPPTYLGACQEVLVIDYGAEVCDGYEADDALGIAATEYDSITATIDKDLMQIPGLYYDFIKHVIHTVDNDSADKLFWTLMLTGDRADNIIGVRGIGPVKAERYLNNAPNRMELVRALYNDDTRFWNNYTLIRVIRTREELDKKLEIFNEKTV